MAIHKRTYVVLYFNVQNVLQVKYFNVSFENLINTRDFDSKFSYTLILVKQNEKLLN